MSASGAPTDSPAAPLADTPFRSDVTWPICEPEFVVQQLKQLLAADCNNGKLFYKSYGPYSKLTDVQKNKVKEFFDSQSDEVKRRVHDGALTSSTTHNANSSARAEATNKDDRARLLQLSQYPEAQAFWTATKNPLDREELDDDNVTTLTAYRGLAGIFNDYPTTNFQNLAIEYEGNLPLAPYVARKGAESIVAQVWDIDPNNSARPERDEKWVQKNWKELRATLTKIFTNFTKSGEQDGQDKAGEWLKFSSNYSNVHIYAILVVPMGVMDQFGKALPAEHQRDSGRASDNRDLSLSPSAVNKRRQRERKATENGSSSSSSSVASKTTKTSHSAASISEVVGASMRNANQQQALASILQFGDPEARARALAALTTIAYEPVSGMTTPATMGTPLLTDEDDNNAYNPGHYMDYAVGDGDTM
mmetsp:Transcript_11145/g.24759  ORF Transcript_11145/g.24759 Transcript_11145/m.24759 type:complete len:420 (-) Transcript_11145:1657-2916(-)